MRTRIEGTKSAGFGVLCFEPQERNVEELPVLPLIAVNQNPYRSLGEHPKDLLIKTRIDWFVSSQIKGYI